MGSDLFESYVGSIISAITLAAVAAANSGGAFDQTTAALFPLIISAIGIVASLIGIFMVKGKEGSNPANALNMGTYVSGAIVIVAVLILSNTMLGSMSYAIAIIAGLIVGIAIGKITEVYTSGDFKHVKKFA
jgi:K(+)-stimulated pyrophosphate-energized sodium pump